MNGKEGEGQNEDDGETKEKKRGRLGDKGMQWANQ